MWWLQYIILHCHCSGCSWYYVNRSKTVDCESNLKLYPSHRYCDKTKCWNDRIISFYIFIFQSSAENECVSGKSCVNGACFRNADSAEENCRCFNGFTLSSTNTSVCEDVNECDNGHQCDKDQGVCINITPGYTCDCSDGYELDEDQRSCIGRCTSIISPIIYLNPLLMYIT